MTRRILPESAHDLLARAARALFADSPEESATRTRITPQGPRPKRSRPARLKAAANRLAPVLAAAEAAAFAEAHSFPFTDTIDDTEERLIILFSEELAALLVLETEDAGTGIARGRFYANWHSRARPQLVMPAAVPFGGVQSLSLFKDRLPQMLADGAFVAPWTRATNIDLTHRGDYVRNMMRRTPPTPTPPEPRRTRASAAARFDALELSPPATTTPPPPARPEPGGTSRTSPEAAGTARITQLPAHVRLATVESPHL